MYNKFLGTGELGYNPWRRIKICLSGMRYAIRYDFSVSYKFVLSAIILLISFAFRQWLDFLLIMAATGQVLIAEMFNSAIEALCDFIETKKNYKIKVIKDIAAAEGISIPDLDNNFFGRDQPSVDIFLRKVKNFAQRIDPSSLFLHRRVQGKIGSGQGACHLGERAAAGLKRAQGAGG